jgi:hypothetical protein
MTIPEAWSRFKGATGNVSEGAILVLIIALVGTAGFGLGRLSKIQDSRVPLQVLGADGQVITGSTTTIQTLGGE